jgi:hypothetical protein
VREGFIIAGSVAMWRPLEIYLYDWWHIRAEWRLLQRLGPMRVRIMPPHPTPVGPGALHAAAVA